MKILFLTTILLSQNRNGGEVSTQCYIDGLTANGHEVSILGYLRQGDSVTHNQQNTIVVGEKYTETKQSKIFAIYWLLLSFLKNLPYSSAKYYSKAYIKIVQECLMNKTYDIVIIDHPQIAWLERFIKNKYPLITISHNVEYELYLENSRLVKNFILKLIYKREAYLLKAEEDRLATVCNQVWSGNEKDAKYFSSINGCKAIAFGQAPTSEKILDQPMSKQFDIGLLGNWKWRANEEALQWFVQSVYPHIPTNLSIHIAGKGADWLTGKYPNIEYRGVVPDAQEFMAQARVIAIPTLSGGGIQIKTLDAISSGSFIVATPVALRRIYCPPSTVKVAENPEEFAKLVTSTVSFPSTQETFEEGRNWYRNRRNKFIHDIAYAINDLCVQMKL